MFTGIVQGTAQVIAVQDQPGLRGITLQFPAGFCDGLAVGASVACDGVCLTVTARDAARDQADFDVMHTTLALTTLGGWQVGQRVNVERSATQGAEIGGHVVSGHVDAQARIARVSRPANGHVLRLTLPARSMRYVFERGFIAVNGASLTVSQANRADAWFEVSLIPETLRTTTFGSLAEGTLVNVEIDRHTQVLVDTIEGAMAQHMAQIKAELLQALSAAAPPARP